MRKTLGKAALFLVMVGIAGPGSGGVRQSSFFPLFQTGPSEPQRNPFRAAEAEFDAPRPAGLAGVAVTEAAVRGIVRYRVPPEGNEAADDGAWAILESSTGEGFVAGPGDRLFDGVLGLIEDGGVIFWLEGDRARPVYRPLTETAADAREGA